jgi:hypothetical protein
MTEDALRAALKRAASTAAIHQRTTGLEPEDEIDYDSLVSEMVHRKETGVRSIVRPSATASRSASAPSATPARPARASRRGRAGREWREHQARPSP